MIEFTQYLRPNGRKVPVSITRPADIQALADGVKAKGGVFEIEEMMTGMVSMTVHLPGEEDEPIAHELCPNGPGVPAAVDQLVKTASKALQTR